MIRARSFAGVLVAAGSLLACSDESGPNISGLDPMSISRIEISPALDTLWVGDTITAADARQYAALVIGRTGGPISGAELWWSTSDVNVATVTTSGRVVPTGRGTVQVKASAGKEGVATLVVAYGTASMTVSPAAVQAVAGDVLPLVAQAYDRDGAPMSGVEYRYVSSSPAVVAVDWTGMMTFTGPGTATITVTGGDEVETVDVTSHPRQFQAGAAMLTGGGDFTCGMLPLGRAYCWGRNDVSQLAAAGDTTCFNDLMGGTVACSLEALRVAGGHSFTQISAGGRHACALDAAGQAWCWGEGSRGQLGNGRIAGASEPALVTSALRFTQISAGDEHTCAIATSGRVWCWGNDEYGQLGNDHIPLSSTTPVPVDGNALYQRVEVGYEHSCAVTNGGTMHCWGANERGQAGQTIGPNVLVPTVVAGGPFADVQSGGEFTCGITAAGGVSCWGRGEEGQLGSGSLATTSSAVAVTGTFASLTAGSMHACAVTAGGQASCWGSIELNPASGHPHRLIGATPMAVPSATPIASVSAGRRHSCAVTTSGDTMCWGSNLVGAFGDGLQTLWDGTPATTVMAPRN